MIKEKLDIDGVACLDDSPVAGVTRPNAGVIWREERFSTRIWIWFHNPNASAYMILKTISCEEELWDKVHNAVALGLECQANDAERLPFLFGLELHIISCDGDTDTRAFSFHGSRRPHLFEGPVEVVKCQFLFSREEMRRREDE